MTESFGSWELWEVVLPSAPCACCIAWRSDSSVSGEPPNSHRDTAHAQHVGVDRVALIQVQAEAGQILQPQIAIAVDVRVGQPGAEVCGRAGVVGEEIDGRVDADLAPATCDTGAYSGCVQLRLISSTLICDRLDLADSTRS